MDVGKRIKQLRELKGLSINRLANMAGVSQSYLRDIELGNKNTTVAFLSLLCEQLEIPLYDFFKEDQSSFLDDPLIEVIYTLSNEQRDLLYKLIKSFN